MIISTSNLEINFEMLRWNYSETCYKATTIWTNKCGSYTQVVFIYPFNNIPNIYQGGPVKCGLYKRVVLYAGVVFRAGLTVFEEKCCISQLSHRTARGMSVFSRFVMLLSRESYVSLTTLGYTGQKLRALFKVSVPVFLYGRIYCNTHVSSNRSSTLPVMYCGI